MLVLSRKVGERIVIAGGVELQVLAVDGNRVSLGFVAPREIQIRRAELVGGSTAGPPAPAPVALPAEVAPQPPVPQSVLVAAAPAGRDGVWPLTSTA